MLFFVMNTVFLQTVEDVVLFVMNTVLLQTVEDVVLFVMNIPDICHFFTQAKFCENKIYTEKRQFFALNL